MDRRIPQQELDVELYSELLKELATELDLHYEDCDFFALSPTIAVMKKAQARLEELGGATPEAVAHVFARYNKSRN